MEEKKSIKIRLETGICIFIILLLIVALISTIVYYKNLHEEKKYVPITSEKFKNYIGKQGFDVYNALDYLPDSTFKEGIKVGYLTHKNNDKDFQINFFEFLTETYTMYSYYNEVITIEKNNNEELVENNINTSNYSKYTALSNEYYYVMIRIDNTVIYTKTDKDNKQIVDNLLQELGY